MTTRNGDKNAEPGTAGPHEASTQGAGLDTATGSAAQERPTRRPRRGLFALAAAAAVLGAAGALAVSAITGGDHDTAQPADASSAGTAQVSRGDIANVLALNSHVVVRPVYTIPAPYTGVFTSAVAADQDVDTGEVLGTVTDDNGDHDILAAAPGRILDVPAADGGRVTAGLPTIAVQHSAFALQATIAGTDLYRLRELGPDHSARASLDKGPGPFDCPLLGGAQ